jgi:hypothetical protein
MSCVINAQHLLAVAYSDFVVTRDYHDHEVVCGLLTCDLL